MKSLRAMVRQVQTDIGVSPRGWTRWKARDGAGRAEQDMIRAQLSEVRADVKSIKRTIPAAAEEALRRSVAAEKHAAAAHAHCTELGNALATTRKECARMVERVDLVAHGADAGCVPSTARWNARGRRCGEPRRRRGWRRRARWRSRESWEGSHDT